MMLEARLEGLLGKSIVVYMDGGFVLSGVLKLDSKGYVLVRTGKEIDETVATYLELDRAVAIAETL